MTLDWLLTWWNVIFIAPFFLALLYLFVYAASGLTFGEADADADVGAEAHAHDEADADADVDAGADVEGDVDAEAHVETDVEADAGEHPAGDGSGGHGQPHPSLQAAALSWLGVGRVPLSILLMVLLFAWGATGFVANQVARAHVRLDWQVALVSLPLAAVVALFATRVVVRAMDRWVPLHQTTSVRRHDLLGEAGVAIFPISERFGMVSVRDGHGGLHHMPCRMERGREPVAKGARVILTGYSASTKSYYVIPADAVPQRTQHHAGSDEGARVG